MQRQEEPPPEEKKRKAMTKLILNLGTVALLINIGLACSRDIGYGVVQEPINLLKREY